DLVEADLVQSSRLHSGHQRGCALQVHDVDVVIADVLFQGTGQFRTLGRRHGNQVLDAHGVQHLATETLCDNASADALSRRIDGTGSTSWASADNEHVKRRALADLLRITDGGAGVDLRQDFLNTHAALGERFAIQVY